MTSSFRYSELVATLFDQLALNAVKAELGPLAVGALGACAYLSLRGAVEEEGMGESNAYWNVLSTIVGTLTGSLYWGEELGVRRMAGIGMGAMGLYLMDS